MFPVVDNTSSKSDKPAQLDTVTQFQILKKFATACGLVDSEFKVANENRESELNERPKEDLFETSYGELFALSLLNLTQVVSILKRASFRLLGIYIWGVCFL